MKNKIRAEQFGQLQRARRALPLFALAAAKASKRGEVTVDDAMELYLDYYRVSSGKRAVKPTDPGVKANASKLRQIIKGKCPELLVRVMRHHSRIAGEGQVKPRPLYATMVEACRLQLAQGRKPLGDQRILALLTRRK